jgi:putative transposase
MTRTHKVRIYPNDKKQTVLLRHCGVARLTYNWGLNEWNEMYKAGEKPNRFSVKLRWNHQKRENFPFVYEVSKWCQEAALQDLSKGFDKFFKKQNHHPKFHKKGVKDSFRIDGSVVKVDDKTLHLPKKLSLRMAEPLRWQPTKIYNVTVSRRAGMWFASISMEVPDTRNENQVPVGIDLGIKALATLSDGSVYANAKALNRYERLLKIRQRNLSRKQKGSANRKKAMLAVAKTHYKIASLRQDVIHKMTSDVCGKYGVICLEDLNVAGMLKNHKLARSISDASFGEIRRQFEYKANEVWLVGRFEPTSKTCSGCGSIKDMPLSLRQYECEPCGLDLDRDHNAAINILRLAKPLMAMEGV